MTVQYWGALAIDCDESIFNHISKVYYRNTYTSQYTEIEKDSISSIELRSNYVRGQIVIQFDSPWSTTLGLKTSDITMRVSGATSKTGYSVYNNTTYSNSIQITETSASSGWLSTVTYGMGSIFAIVITSSVVDPLKEFNFNLTLCYTDYDSSAELAPQSVKLYANDGCEFAEIPTYISGGITKEMAAAYGDVSGVQVFLYYYANYLDIDNGSTITGICQESQTTDQTPFIGIHKPNRNKLLEVLNKRIITDLTTLEAVDNQQYIIGVYQTSLDIETTTNSEIYYGKYATGVQSPTVINAIITKDSASQVLYISRDVERITWKPRYCDEIDIDSHSVKYKTCFERYRINPVNGDCLCSLVVDGVELYKTQGNVYTQLSIPNYYQQGLIGEYKDEYRLHEFNQGIQIIYKATDLSFPTLDEHDLFYATIDGAVV